MIDPDELAQYEYDVAPEIQVMSKTKRAPGSPAPATTPSSADQSYAAWDDRNTRRAARAHRNAEANSSLGLGGALQGAARYALLDIPEPVAAADTNFDRAITQEEFTSAAAARFQLLDRSHQGKISLAQLEMLRPIAPADGPRPKRNLDAPDTRVGNPLPPGS